MTEEKSSLENIVKKERRLDTKIKGAIVSIGLCGYGAMMFNEQIASIYEPLPPETFLVYGVSLMAGATGMLSGYVLGKQIGKNQKSVN